MTNAAVVVSFNRKELLRKCLESLQHQTLQLDEIIVVDNSSTDGAAEMVADEFPSVILYRSAKNLGGAGGFSWGVEIAITRGHHTAWLMDDDGNPELDAFEKLIDAFGGDISPFAFAASLVTVGRDEPNMRNPPEFSGDVTKQFSAWRHNLVAIDSATFVGVLVNLDFAKRTPLPVADFFIWGDDLEYTRRLSSLGQSVLVPLSQIRHPAKPPSTTPMGDRLFYLVRNGFWRRKQVGWGFISWASATVEGLVNTVGQLRLPGNKLRVLSRFVKGIAAGTFTSPKLVMPGNLMRSDKTVQLVSHKED